MMTVIAIIPCRSGSVGIKDKNIRQFLGMPLMCQAIGPATNSKMINEVIVSTDSQEYADIATSYGASVPFLRPPKLSEDVPTEDVILYLIRKLNKDREEKIDIVVTMQCTTPGILPLELDYMIEKVMNGGFDSATTFTLAMENPEWMYTSDKMGKMTHISTNIEMKGKVTIRQNLGPKFRLTGAAYVTSVEMLMKHKQLLPGNLFGFQMPIHRSIDIDTEYDFHVAELLLNNPQHTVLQDLMRKLRLQ